MIEVVFTRKVRTFGEVEISVSMFFSYPALVVWCFCLFSSVCLIKRLYLSLKPSDFKIHTFVLRRGAFYHLGCHLGKVCIKIVRMYLEGCALGFKKVLHQFSFISRFSLLCLIFLPLVNKCFHCGSLPSTC